MAQEEDCNSISNRWFPDRESKGKSEENPEGTFSATPRRRRPKRTQQHNKKSRKGTIEDHFLRQG